ncbi:hypothetical protein ACFT9I_31505 [Streptomyces sp. NPDC057137]|uniref:HAAS signaling domain-containing protein n=1 Tax=Streptomyces sp. NPDC057137 TaxID=3346030 RepID=UPI003627AAF7
MTSTGDRLVEEYLGRLDNASVFLTTERRAELRQEIVEHIDAGLEEADVVHADAVRAVLKRLGPPADIVASELGPRSAGSTGSTGATPVVTPVSAPVRGAAGHDGGGHAPLAGASGGGPAPVPPARPWKVSRLLIGSVAVAAVLGVLVLGATISSSDVDQQQRSPSITPSQSGVPGSEVSDPPPEIGPDTSLTPSEQTSEQTSEEPLEQPSEQLSEQPTESTT